VLVLNSGGEITAYYVEKEGFVVLAGFLRLGSSSALISYDTTDFHIEGKEGSWLAYDSIIIDGREFFLMEHTVYGAQAANVVLDSAGNMVADNVFHGFDGTVKQQIWEYLHPPAKEPEPEKTKKPVMENWQKAYENGEYLRSAEITEEQNYNMIDGRMNNLPKASEDWRKDFCAGSAPSEASGDCQKEREACAADGGGRRNGAEEEIRKRKILCRFMGGIFLFCYWKIE